MLKDLISHSFTPRTRCLKCSRVLTLCYCDSIQTFEIEPLIVLLVHPKEYRHSVGTVRIVKLAIPESILIQGKGKDFDQELTLNTILDNPLHHCMILYPGDESLNLSALSHDQRVSIPPPGKRLVIFVIDGTWGEAKKMIRDSDKLRKLPRVSFQVQQPSVYGFRKQPKEYCLSTVEAVTEFIEVLQKHQLCKVSPPQAHHQMIASFKKLIQSQIQFENRNLRKVQ